MGWTDISDVTVATKVSYQIMNELKDNFVDVKTQREIQHETNGTHTLNGTGGLEYSSGLQIKTNKKCGISSSGVAQKLAGYSSIHATDGDYTTIKNAVDSSKTHLQIMGTVDVGSSEVTLLDNSIIKCLGHQHQITMQNNLILGNNCLLDNIYPVWVIGDNGKQIKATSKDYIKIKNSRISTSGITTPPLYFIDDCNHLDVVYNFFTGNSINKAIYCYTSANVEDMNLSDNYFTGFPFQGGSGGDVFLAVSGAVMYRDIKIKGNQFSSTGGINLKSVDHSIISKNKYGRCYSIDDCDYNTISGNNIPYGEASESMIKLVGSDRNVISGNNVYKDSGTATDGINLDAASNNNEVIGNITRGWSGSGITNSGAANDLNYNQDY